MSFDDLDADELSTTDPLEELISQIQGTAAIPEISLDALGALDGEPLARVREMWNGLDSDRRIELIWSLTEAAADNLALDFAEMARLAINDPEPAVREQAYLLTTEDGSESLFEPILHAAAEDPDHEARVNAIEALGIFTLQAEADAWADERVGAAQAVLLNDLHSPTTDITLRKAALLSLSYLTTPEAEAEIRQAYMQPDLRQTAIEAMGRNAQDIWFADLRSELQSEQSAYRLAAVLACVEMEDERLIPDLLERVEDPEAEVRLAAVSAIGSIGGSDAETALDEVERSSDPALRRAAVRALADARGRDEFFSFGPELIGKRAASEDDADYSDEYVEGEDDDEQDEDDDEDR